MTHRATATARSKPLRAPAVGGLLVVAGAILAACRPEPAIDAGAVGVLELDAPALAAELAAGRVSAEAVTRAVLARIAAIDAAGPALNSIIEINPDAIAIARELDRRFAAQGPAGPLHGVPIALKANIDTADRMATSAGSLALREHYAVRDAEIVSQLRAAGAVIVAKTNLSEWANFRSSRSTSGWSSLGGQTKNPYALERNPCGSSSGSAVAVAARIVPLAVGTETDGSIVCPAGANGIVGIKPARGRVSGAGIIPISTAQDTAGPMARTVAGAALLLEVLQDEPRAARGPRASRGPQAAPRDSQARRGNASQGTDLAAADLTGTRLGVVRDYFGAGANADVEALFSESLATLAAQGAELVDPIEIAMPASARAYELEALLYEFGADLTAYLSAAVAAHTPPPASMPGSLEALIEFNRTNADTVMPHFGQELLERASAARALDAPSYAEAVAGSRDAMTLRLAEIFEAFALDALIAPANAPAWTTDYVRGDAYGVGSSSIAALAGYPSIAVPAGLIDDELPVAIALVGRPDAEDALIAIAAAFERARGPLPAPRLDR